MCFIVMLDNVVSVVMWCCFILGCVSVFLSGLVYCIYIYIFIYLLFFCLIIFILIIYYGMFFCVVISNVYYL